MVTRIINKLFPGKIIHNCFKDPYLHRWHLFRSRRFTVMLHKFYRSDEDRALHCHPWSFITILLWRGYYEHTERREECFCNPEHGCWRCFGSGYCVVPVKKRKWPLSILWRPAEWRHRVELVKGKPAWTLVIHFKRRREWGYYMPRGFIRHDQWWQENCE